ncbi:putative bifunctional diguanylate cyclase/phosphodiesterase [Longispora albida]|uniref:putative bifunctional diguanylate cyclase/phosphodiesterase n=1 Tax=Longispora albida TaxID=203523 RepID=UPI0003823583|nr:bifunctional diguanylate cyclase/phosphodiesterase [Longispora albida]
MPPRTFTPLIKAPWLAAGLGSALLATGLALGATTRLAVRLITTGGTLATLLCLTGLLTLAVATWSQRLRYVLDGLIVAGSGIFLFYLLILGPSGLSSPPPVITALAWVAAAASGIGAVAYLRSNPPRTPIAVVATAVPALPAACFVLAFAFWYRMTALTTLGLLLMAAAFAFLLLAAHRAAHHIPAPAPTGHATLPRLGTGLSTVPVAAALIAALYWVLMAGPLPAHMAYGATAIAAALIGRQALTMRDARRYADELAVREAHFRSIVSGASDMTLILDSTLTTTWLSPSASRRLGDGQCFLRLTHPEDAEMVVGRLRQVLDGSGGTESRLDSRILDTSGIWRDIESTISDQRHVPQVGGLVMHSRDVTERKRLERELAQMAFTDPLTGLGNRRALLSTLAEVRGRTCTLLTLDLDGFKNVNDVRGHDVGDAVLAQVASRLRANLRPGDVPTRLGGDEFAVLMWSPPDRATSVAERLRRILSTPYEVGDLTVFLSASIGLAGCRTAEDVPTLLRNADIALRSAKRGGKNRVEEYDHAYALWMARRMELAQELRGAAERGELSFVYQPILTLASRRLIGVEALLRWRHPRLGVVEPGEFIPVAEESSLVADLGTWALHEACRQLSVWLRAGYDLWVSVNVSTSHIQAPEFPGLLNTALRAHRVPSGRLVLEVTDHRVTRGSGALADRIADVRAMGVRVALDDFGAGHSSLAQLRTLPVDIVKIDENLESLADIVVQLGRRLGLEVIVEGIEEPAQLTSLLAAGCELGQGYLLGHPMPAEHLEALLADSDPPPVQLDPVQQASPIPQQDQLRHGLSQRLRETYDHDVGQVDSAHEMRQA